VVSFVRQSIEPTTRLFLLSDCGVSVPGVRLVKSHLYRFSLERMCSAYERIEASPLGSRLACGAFWSLAGALIDRGLGLLSTILVGRLLGATEFGELGVIQNTVGMFGTLAGFGMGLTANKHIAEFKHTNAVRAGRILILASSTAWMGSAFMALLLVVVAPWLAVRALAAPHLAPMLQIGALLVLLGGINGAQTGALSGFEAFKAVARINLIAGVASFPLMVLGAWRWGVTGSLWGLVASQFLNFMLCWFATRSEARRFGIRPVWSGWRGEWRLLTNFSLPAALTGVLNSVVMWGAGALLVNQAGGYEALGIYSAASRVKQLPEVLLAMLTAPVLPVLSECWGRGDRISFQRTLLFNFLLATLIIVPVSLVQAAAPALTLLPFGAAYHGNAAIVQWLMLHAVACALMFPMGSILISMGRMWFSCLVNWLYALLLAGTSLLLVPRFGAAGYAATLFIAYTLSNIVCVVFLYRELPDVMRYLRWGLVALSASLLFGASVVVADRFPLPLALASGVIAVAAFLAIQLSVHRHGLHRLQPVGRVMESRAA
jgi:O-antigen/teichoic acid export membrane protein